MFGTGKRAYGMDIVMAKLQVTSVTVIMVAVISMNLKKLLAFYYDVLYLVSCCFGGP